MKTVFSVPQMHCNKCVANIRKALETQGFNAEINLSTQQVHMDCDETQAPQIIEILDEIGFDAQIAS